MNQALFQQIILEHPRMLYVYGLMYGDGCLHYRVLLHKNSYHSGHRVLKSKPYSQKRYEIIFSNTSKELVDIVTNTLNRFLVTDKKISIRQKLTFNNKKITVYTFRYLSETLFKFFDKNNLKHIDAKQFWEFFSGLFDAEGNVYHTRTQSPRFRISNSDFKLISFLKTNLVKFEINYSITNIPKYNNKIRKVNNFYRILFLTKTTNLLINNLNLHRKRHLLMIGAYN